MKLSLKHTRQTLPGVVFIAVLLTSQLRAESLKTLATFTLDIPIQSHEPNRRGGSGIEYVRPETLAVWYTEKVANGQLSRRDKLGAEDPWRLNLQLVSRNGGAVTQKLQWPTRRNSSALVVASTRIPVLLTGPVVHCFTPEFREIRSFTVNNADKPKEIRILRHSPGSSVVWLIEASESTTATRIDTRSCMTSLTHTERTPEATIVGSDEMLLDSNAEQVGLWLPQRGWKLLYTADCCLSNASFVAPDLVGLVRSDPDQRRRFLVINLQGKCVIDDPVRAGYEFGGIVPSDDAKTAAVVFTQRDIAATEVGIRINHTDAKIRLYDLQSRKRIGDLDIMIPGENAFGIAIAPDSTELTILNGSKLSIYDLRH